MIEGLNGLLNLESLWLGKNKIEDINGIAQLRKLKKLDVQNNRLSRLGEELSEMENLEELYLACNAIETVDGLPTLSPLSIVDFSTNRLQSIEGKSLWNRRTIHFFKLCYFA